MNIGDEVVACFRIKLHEDQKCIAIYGVGVFLDEQIPTEQHPLHPKERFGQPRFPQLMVQIGDTVISEWQYPITIIKTL
ncbi:hypothetical protein [Xenorhabdus bovienii]|uniref:hypothetical protein n=1 Tax=Xenorhabdus bovienii TaxID=40576 RepID=UPI0023B22BE4|nr:hypothetical protein [Xenorhabdus bovienii]MDE9454630.1 hypothetical protein [Xenorhabdus bovienii]MDE9494380.1 hypothetical protein [Xenorhabdus bovienii]MDE9502819.1 hypothetical protein [Xenorhabdus bovienii]MDE9526434.1 hypothetical protein [Xenorhabdus bovienii]MDE9568775.1 hypothetical protein [Xenorhabdus bovienii]